MGNLAAAWQKEWNPDWAAYGLPILPNYPLAPQTTYRSSVTETEAGYVRSLPLQSYPRRRWEGLVFGPLTTARMTTLMDFLEARKVQGFVWTLPDGTDVHVQLLEVKVEKSRTGPGRYTVRASFIELDVGPDYMVDEDRNEIWTEDGDRIII